MPNLMAASFEGVLPASFTMRCLERGDGRPDGWGVGWYPSGEPAASVIKEPASNASRLRADLVRAWGHVVSSVFLLHLRDGTWGQVSEANTQPFTRSFAGFDWMLGHAGSLDHRFELQAGARFQPMGSTDSERILCDLLDWIAEGGFHRIGELDLEALLDWLHRLNGHGASSLAFTDGLDLVVYADMAGRGEMWLHELVPPGDRFAFGDADLEVHFGRHGGTRHKGFLVTAGRVDPLGLDGRPGPRQDAGPPARMLAPGSMAVIRLGALRAELGWPAPVGPPQPGGRLPKPLPAVLGPPAPVRRFDIEHRTTYRYAEPVKRSTHLLRLEPVHDLLQSKLSHEVELSVDGRRFEYEDVFGNRVLKVDLDVPYRELSIIGRARVEVRDTDPLGFHTRLNRRSTIPLIWMPWQRHMLQPYLLPPELPETQLRELTDYAMSFVDRNGGDLLEMLVDLNGSIHRDYRYVPGVTHLATTPFDVYLHRRGVCQDFANLFICLARLLGVPARYVCGYIYTGPKAENRAQSEASHAWVQVYLPEVGWRGFDPTNGLVTRTDHVRVAHGRNYVDATPTSGTIFHGGGAETLEVAVRCEPSEG